MPRMTSVAFMAVLLVACTVASPTGAPESVASETPVSTASLLPGPTAMGTPDPTPKPLLAPDDIAMVVTNDLVLRSAPGTGSDSEIHRGLLNEPTRLLILDGPITASGYQWYQVHPFALGEDLPARWRLGWVASAGKDGEAWIAPSSVECDEAPTLEMLIRLNSIARLACYGDRTLTFGASYEGPTAVIPNVVSPNWLSGFGYVLEPIGCVFECPKTPISFTPFLFAHRRDDSGGDPQRFFGHAVPSDVQVVGHFDDRVAQSCLAGLLPGESSVPPVEQTILECRTQFVVTEATGITH